MVAGFAGSISDEGGDKDIKEMFVMFDLVPFSGRKGLAHHHNGFNSLFDVFNDPFFRDDFMPFGGFSGGTFKVDVEDKGDSYELTADLPGMTKEDIALNYENDYLTIAARKNEQKDDKDAGGNFIRRERRIGNVSRSFYVGDIDSAKIDAEFKDGVLKVTMPKAPEVQQSTAIAIR